MKTIRNLFFMNVTCLFVFTTQGFANPNIYLAAYDGNTTALEKLVKKNKKLNLDLPAAQTSFGGLSALSIATYQGHTETVNFLLAQGANPDSVSKDGFTPLLLSVERGNQKITQDILLELQNTPSHLAQALNRNLPIQLTTSSVKPAIAVLHDELHEALYYGGFMSEEGILSEVKEINLKTRSLDPCMESESTSSQKILLFGTALHLAAAKCEVEIAEMLIKAGAQIDNPRELDHATPLRLALHAGCIDVAKLLLSNGADRELAVYQGEKTPLILQSKAELDDKIFRTKVAEALKEGHFKLARSILLAYSLLQNKSDDSDPFFVFHQTLDSANARRLTLEAMSKVFDSDSICAICLSEMDSKDSHSLLACTHHFHKNCLGNWLGKSQTCPTCRAPTQNGNQSLVYDTKNF